MSNEPIPPTHEQMSVLAVVVRAGDLTVGQREHLAQLVGQVGTAVRMSSVIAARYPVNAECVGVLWELVAGVYGELLQALRTS